MEVFDRHIGPAGRVSFGERGRSAGEGRGSMVDERALAEALAILMVDLVDALIVADRNAVLERLANRLDDQAHASRKAEAGRLIGAVSKTLLMLEINCH